MSRTKRTPLPPTRWNRPKPGVPSLDDVRKTQREAQEQHAREHGFSDADKPVPEAHRTSLDLEIRLAMIGSAAGATIMEVRRSGRGFQALVKIGEAEVILAFRYRRGTLVMVPPEWRGRTVNPQTIKKRPSKLPRKQGRENSWKAQCMDAKVPKRQQDKTEVADQLRDT